MKIISQLHILTALPREHGPVFVRYVARWSSKACLHVVEKREIFYPSRESNLDASVIQPATSSLYQWVIQAVMYVCVSLYVCTDYRVYLFYSTWSLELYLL